jgi:hypothetical protein
MKIPKRRRGRTKPAAAFTSRNFVLGAVADLSEALLAEMDRTGL